MNSASNFAQEDKNDLLALTLEIVNLSQFVIKLSHFFQGVVERRQNEKFILHLQSSLSTVNAGLNTVVEKIPSKIECIRFKSSDSKMPVAVSIGSANLETKRNTARVSDRADKNLYRAKNLQ